MTRTGRFPRRISRAANWPCWCRDLAPLAGRRYAIAHQGTAVVRGKATAAGATLANEKLRLRLDEKTGGIVELRAQGIDVNLTDIASGHAINDYLYLIGDDLAGLQGSGPVKITVRNRGPLVASLLVESEAPGCHKLSREIRLVAGGDYVELLDTVDKRRLVAASYIAKEGRRASISPSPSTCPVANSGSTFPWA